MSDKISRKKILEYIDKEIEIISSFNVISFREKMMLRGQIQALSDLKFVLVSSTTSHKFDYIEESKGDF